MTENLGSGNVRPPPGVTPRCLPSAPPRFGCPMPACQPWRLCAVLSVFLAGCFHHCCPPAACPYNAGCPPRILACPSAACEPILPCSPYPVPVPPVCPPEAWSIQSPSPTGSPATPTNCKQYYLCPDDSSIRPVAQGAAPCRDGRLVELCFDASGRVIGVREIGGVQFPDFPPPPGPDPRPKPRPR